MYCNYSNSNSNSNYKCIYIYILHKSPPGGTNQRARRMIMAGCAYPASLERCNRANANAVVIFKYVDAPM